MRLKTCSQSHSFLKAFNQKRLASAKNTSLDVKNSALTFASLCTSRKDTFSEFWKWRQFIPSTHGRDIGFYPFPSKHGRGMTTEQGKEPSWK
jgi:hypothetical protein